jgi:hypothetical protein
MTTKDCWGDWLEWLMDGQGAETQTSPCPSCHGCPNLQRVYSLGHDRFDDHICISSKPGRSVPAMLSRAERATLLDANPAAFQNELVSRSLNLKHAGKLCRSSGQVHNSTAVPSTT